MMKLRPRGEQRAPLSSEQQALRRTQIHRDRALPVVWPIRQPDVLRIARELVGRRFGKLTVMGLSAVPTSTSGNHGKWVVRCDCGAYEVRRRSVLLRSDVSHHCDACDAEIELAAGRKPLRAAEARKV